MCYIDCTLGKRANVRELSGFTSEIVETIPTFGYSPGPSPDTFVPHLGSFLLTFVDALVPRLSAKCLYFEITETSSRASSRWAPRISFCAAFQDKKRLKGKSVGNMGFL